MEAQYPPSLPSFATFLRSLLPAFLLVAGSGCSSGAGDSARAGEEEGPVPVQCVRVRAEPVFEDLSISSVLRPRADVEVRAKASGQVVGLEVEEGDRVEPEHPLGRLEDEREQYRLVEAEAELNLRRKEWERSQDLHESKTISEVDFERSRYELRTAEARWEQARLDLAHRTITSPIAGVVMERWIDVGDFVEEGQPLFRMVGTSVLRADLYLAEKERAWVGRGVRARVIAAGRDETAEITRVSPVIDPSSGTFKVTFLLDNAAGTWIPGESCTFVFRRDEATQVLTLPRTALQERNGEGETYVFRVEGDVVRRVPVTFAQAEEGRIRILDGLSEGDDVVYRSKRMLEGGERVTVLSDSQSQ
jgi:membrane fusion protein (multidrug efflux system)